jgi:hypothetical protein
MLGRQLTFSSAGRVLWSIVKVSPVDFGCTVVDPLETA